MLHSGDNFVWVKGGAENGRDEIGRPENGRPNLKKNRFLGLPFSGLPISVDPNNVYEDNNNDDDDDVMFSSRLRLGLRLGLDLVFGWLLVMHTYLYCYPSSLYRTRVCASVCCLNNAINVVAQFGNKRQCQLSVSCQCSLQLAFSFDLSADFGRRGLPSLPWWKILTLLNKFDHNSVHLKWSISSRQTFVASTGGPMHPRCWMNQGQGQGHVKWQGV